jgi:hypothetical protein
MPDALPGALLGLAETLLLTVFVESGVGWLFGLRAWRPQGMLLLVNVITNPLLNLIIKALAAAGLHAVRSPFDPLVAALELIVAAAEAAMLRALLGLKPGRAIALSAAANAASWLAGALLLG